MLKFFYEEWSHSRNDLFGYIFYREGGLQKLQRAEPVLTTLIFLKKNGWTMMKKVNSQLEFMSFSQILFTINSWAWFVRMKCYCLKICIIVLTRINTIRINTPRIHNAFQIWITLLKIACELVLLFCTIVLLSNLVH